VISISNFGATIQLNGDVRKTIVKKDVTKVQAIGINVLIVEREIVKTLIPFTSVNSPNTFSTSQALADYISFILGAFDTSAIIRNSNLTYEAQVNTSPFPIPDATVNLKDTANTLLFSQNIPSAVPSDIIAPDGTVNVNGNLFDTVASGGTLNVPVEYENGTPVGTIVSGVVEVPNPVLAFRAIIYVESGTTNAPFTKKGVNATITSIDADGLTSLVVEVNSVPVSPPFAIVATDSVELIYDSAGSDANPELIGTYS
jgi:hypothetical protein